MSDYELTLDHFTYLVRTASRHHRKQIAGWFSFTAHVHRSELFFRDASGVEVPLLEVYRRCQADDDTRRWAFNLVHALRSRGVNADVAADFWSDIAGRLAEHRLRQAVCTRSTSRVETSCGVTNMPAQTHPATQRTRLSGWIVAAWVFFGLALIEGIVVGGWWLAARPALADPHAGSAAEIFVLIGTGIAWMISLTFAAVGTVCGLIGAARSAHSRGANWAAVVMNGTVVAVSLVLLFTLTQ